MKPLIIALLAGPMLGCATLPLHEVALRDVVPDSGVAVGGQRPDESQAELADQAAASGVSASPNALRAPPGVPGVSSDTADWQRSTDPHFEPADYRSEGESSPPSVLLAGTMFDETAPEKITLATYDDATASSGAAVPPYFSAASPVGRAAVSNPEVYLLPQLNNLDQSSDPSAAGVAVAGAVNDQHDPVANIVVNTPPANAVEPPGFSQLQNYPLLYNLLNDERNFYRCGSLEWLAVGLGGSAILANTHIDQGFRDAYGESLRPANKELDFLKEFGNGVYVIPALGAIWLVDYSIDWSAGDGTVPCAGWLQEWSGRSMRGLIVGAVPLLTLQYAIGSARPSEGSSRWEPFKSDHGVSGHAYVCAVPFWTAAQMTDCCALEVGFYTAGTLAGWSRIHTDSHYLSQVVMGWWLAGLSVSAVDHTELQKRQWYVTPTVDDEGAGIALIHLQ